MKTNKNKKRIKQTVLFVFLAAILAVIAFFAIQIYMVQSTQNYILYDTSDVPACDAIIVLGAMVYNNGRPSYILQDRLDYGYKLYTQGKAKKILVSGDHGQTNYDEVNAMKEYLMEKGVPAEDIFMDHAGFNTYDSMYRAKAIFCIESLLISTQDFHINRSVYIARNLGIDAYGYPCEDKPIYSMKLFKTRESLARVKAFWDTLIKRNPRYLGDAIPIMGNGNVTDG